VQSTADLPAVVPLGGVPHLKSFWNEETGVEGDDIDIELLGEDRVSDGLIFDAKARRKHDTATDRATHRHEPLAEIQPLALLCQSRC